MAKSLRRLRAKRVRPKKGKGSYRRRKPGFEVVFSEGEEENRAAADHQL